MMTSVDILERYAFVWDGSQPGWTLDVTHYQVAIVVAHFGPSGPTLTEIKALRELDETLGALPIREVYARVGKQSRVVLGRYAGMLLRRIHLGAQAAGIQVTEESARSTWFSLIHAASGRRIDIADEDEGRQLVEAMQARGRRVGIIEAD
jgi:hypothetical protein